MTKRHKYLGAAYWRQPSGSIRAEINHAGRQIRATHPTVDAARAWIEQTKAAQTNRHAPLTPEQIHDAHQALRHLPEGATLTEAAKALATASAEPETPTIQEAVDQFIQEKIDTNLRPRSLATLKNTLGRLARDHGHLPVHRVTADLLNQWFKNQNITGTTANNYRRDIANLYNWLIRHGAPVRNPATLLPRRRVDETLPGILTPQETERFLRHIETNHLPHIHYYTIGFFAGVRPATIHHLTAADIRQSAGYILINPPGSKIRQINQVDIAPNLAAWLRAYPPASGAIIRVGPRRIADITKNTSESLGIRWPHNAMRHSFATYHLAAGRDARATSHQLTHTDPDTLYRHYRSLATASDAALYWQIQPYSSHKNP